jgi:hypothetical protein
MIPSSTASVVASVADPYLLHHTSSPAPTVVWTSFPIGCIVNLAIIMSISILRCWGTSPRNCLGRSYLYLEAFPGQQSLFFPPSPRIASSTVATSVTRLPHKRVEASYSPPRFGSLAALHQQANPQNSRRMWSRRIGRTPVESRSHSWPLDISSDRCGQPRLPAMVVTSPVSSIFRAGYCFIRCR